MVQLELSSCHCILVCVLVFLLWSQFDHVINPEDGDGRLCGKLEAFQLADGWLKNTGLLAISDGPLDQV